MNLKDKKTLVTGADGFMGSHLVERLLKEGAKVKAFVYYNSFNSWGWLENLEKKYVDNIEIVSGDVRDYNCLLKEIENMDVVFHLAALVAIPFSYRAPESYVDTNIKGTLNALLASHNCNIERVLITSTSEVYGTARYVPIDEEHPFQGQSPYSATKIGADRIGESFYKSYDLPVTIVRPFNTYGPRQSARAVIPSIITQLLSGENEIKLGNLVPTRDFNYVKDTVNGFVEIAKSDITIGKEINIASGQEISVRDIFDTIKNFINPNAKIVQDELRFRPKLSEVGRLLGCNRKILELTDWNIEYSLKDGIFETIKWFEENLKYYKHSYYNL